MPTQGSSDRPLYVQLAARIERDVRDGKYARSGRLPSESALAEQFGVSRGTLRQALGSLIRSGVVETVPGRGTFVKGHAVKPVRPESDRTRAIGLVIPGVARTRIPELIDGAEAELRAAGFGLLLGSSGDDSDQEGEQIRRFLREDVAGLLVYPVDGPHNLPLFRQLSREGTPLVLIDRYLVDLEVDAVVADNMGGAFHAVRHLVERGYRRIGFVATHNRSTSSISERYAGYRWALELFGHLPEDGLICTGMNRLFRWPAPDDRKAADNQELLRRYLARERPDAVFAVNDTLACQVLQAAELEHLRVPSDLAVVGFDNLAYPDYAGATLTTVDQPRQEIGATAARLLVERIGGRADSPVRIVLATKLIVRDSSQTENSPRPHTPLLPRAAAGAEAAPATTPVLTT